MSRARCLQNPVPWGYLDLDCRRERGCLNSLCVCTRVPISKEPGLIPALYERLSGPTWHQLSETVRKAHPGTGTLRARGVFRVQHGQIFLARLLALLLRLPSPADATDVQLHVTASERGERWERTFGNRRLVTLQSAAPDSLLAERFGPIEIRFRLHPHAEVLTYLQQGVALRFGRLRLPLPTWLAPRVHAVERAVDATARTHVAVSISLAPLGLLMRYEGEFEVEEESE